MRFAVIVTDSQPQRACFGSFRTRETAGFLAASARATGATAEVVRLWPTRAYHAAHPTEPKEKP